MSFLPFDPSAHDIVDLSELSSETISMGMFLHENEWEQLLVDHLQHRGTLLFRYFKGFKMIHTLQTSNYWVDLSALDSVNCVRRFQRFLNASFRVFSGWCIVKLPPKLQEAQELVAPLNQFFAKPESEKEKAFLKPQFGYSKVRL